MSKVSDCGRLAVGGGCMVVMLFCARVTAQPVPVATGWNTNNDGTWSAAGNWSNGLPNNNANNTFVVTIDRNATGGDPTVMLDINTTIDELTNREALSFNLNRALTVARDVLNDRLVRFNGSATLTADRFTNQAGATLQVIGALGSTNTLAAELFNFGLVDVDRGLTVNASNVSHANAGMIDVRRRERLSFTGNGYSLLNTGSIHLDRRAQIAVNNGTFNLAAGSFTSDIESAIELTNGASMTVFGGLFSHLGDLLVSNSTFHAGLNAHTNLGELRLTTSTYEGVGPLTNSPAGLIRLLGGGVIHSELANEGTMQAVGSTNVLSQALVNSGTVHIGDNNTATALSAAHVQNSGTIQLDYNATLTADRIDILPGARLESIGGAVNTLTANLENRGILLVEENLVLNRTDALYDNRTTGLVDVTTGDLTINGQRGDFRNAGIIRLQNDSTFTLANTTTLTQLAGGRLEGGADSTFRLTANSLFDVGDGQFSHMGDIVLDQSALDLRNASHTNARTVTLIGSSGGTPAEFRAESLTNAGDLRMNGSADVIAPVDNDCRIFVLNGTNTIVSLTNRGGAELSIGNFVTASSLQAGSVVNTKGGVINLNRFATLTGTQLDNFGTINALGGSGNVLTTRLHNFGVINVDNLTLNKVNEQHVNAAGGILNVTGGGFTLTGANTVMTNLGSVNLGAGQTFRITGESVFNHEGGNFNGGPDTRLELAGRDAFFNVNGGAFNFSGDLHVDDATVDLENLAYTNPAGRTITLNGVFSTFRHAEFLSSGQLQNQGILRLEGATRVTAPILNSGDIDVISTSNSLEGAIVNSGSFTIGNNSTSSHSVTVGDLVNQGELVLNRFATLEGNLVSNHALLRSIGGNNNTINAQLRNFGAVEVEKSLTVSRPNISHLNAAQALINVAAGATLNFDGASHNTVNAGFLTLNGDARLLVSGSDARFTQAGTFTSSPDSTLEISGNGANVSLLGGNFAHVGSLTIVGSTVNAVFEAGLTSYRNERTMTMNRATYSSAGATLTNAGDLFLNGTTEVLSPLVNDPGATIQVRSTGNRLNNSAVNQGNLIIGDNAATSHRLDVNRLDNFGTIELNFSSTLGGTRVHNHPFALIRSTGGPNNVLNAELINEANVEVEESLTLNLAGAQHQNIGNITVNHGTFALTAGQIFDPMNNGGIETTPAGEAQFSGATTSARFDDFTNNGRLTITGATVAAGQLHGSGHINSTGTLMVDDDLEIGAGGGLNVGPNSLVQVGGNVSLNVTDPFDIQWAAGAVLRMTGGTLISPVSLEIGGNDVGAVVPLGGAPLGFENNFDMSTLELTGGAHVRLTDLVNNFFGGSFIEALYVDRLVVGAGAQLDANGLNVYYRSLSGMFPALINLGPNSTLVPEPGTLLLVLGATALLARRRQRLVRERHAGARIPSCTTTLVRDKLAQEPLLVPPPAGILSDRPLAPKPPSARTAKTNSVAACFAALLVTYGASARAQTHTATWTGGGASDSWFDAVNWMFVPAGPTVPNNGGADTFAVDIAANGPVILDTADVTLHTLVNNQMLNINSGRNLTLAGAAVPVLMNTGTLRLNGNGTLLRGNPATLQLTNGGLIEVLHGGSSVFSTITGVLNNPGEIRLGNGVNATTLTLTQAFTNVGMFNLQGAASVNATAGPFTNAATGMFRSNGAAAENVLQSNLVNNGNTDVFHDLLLSQTNGAHTNSNVFNLRPAGELNFSGGNSNFTNTGAFTMFGGSRMTLPTGFTFNQNAGMFNLNALAELIVRGSFLVNGGVFTQNGTLRIEGGSFVQTAGTFVNGGMFSLSNTTFNPPLQNNGTLTILNAVTGNGVWTNTVPATLIVGDDVVITTLTLNQNFESDGRVELRGRATMTIPLGTFTNDGMFFSQGIAFPNTLNARLVNNGMATVVNDLSLTRSNVTHTNSGTVSIEAAPLVFGGTGMIWTNTGLFRLTNGSTMTMPAALTFNNNVGGTFRLLAGAVVTLNGIINNNGGMFDQQGELIVTGGGRINQTLSTVMNTGTLRLGGSATIDSPIVNNAEIVVTSTSNAINSTLDNNGDLTIGDNLTASTLNLGQNFINDGNVSLYRNATLALDTITNSAGANIEAVGGPNNTLTARLINGGELRVEQNLNLNRPGVTHQNPNSITILGGNFNVSGTGHTMTNTGDLALFEGTWSINNGTFQNTDAASVVGAPGTLIQLTSATISRAATDVFDHDGDMTLTSSTFAGDYVNAATLTMVSSAVNGSLDNDPAAFVFMNGASNVESTLSNHGTLRCLGTNNVAASLVDHLNSSEIHVGNNATASRLTVGGTLQNSGAISLDFQSTYAGDKIVNGPTGVIRTINGPGDRLEVEIENRGNVFIDHDLVLDKANAVHGNFATGLVHLRGGNLTVSGNNQSFESIGTLQLDAPHTLIISQGNFDQGGGTFNGQPGSLLSIESGATLTLDAGTFNHMGSITVRPGATVDVRGVDYFNHENMILMGQFSPPTLAIFTSLLDSELINAAGGRISLRGQTTISSIVENNVNAEIAVTSTSNTVSKALHNQGLITIGDNAAGSRLDVTAPLVNDGIIELNGVATLGGGDELTNNAVLITIGGLNNVLIAQLDNTMDGFVVLSKPLTIDLPLTTHQNAGSVDASEADLTLSGDNHLFNNLPGGVIELGDDRNHNFAANARMELLGGTMDLGPGTTLTLSNGYDLVINGGVFNGNAASVLRVFGTPSGPAELNATTPAFNHAGDAHFSNNAAFRAASYTNQGRLTFFQSDFIGDELINNADLELNGSSDMITASVLLNQQRMRVVSTANTVSNQLRNTGLLTVGNNLDSSVLGVKLLTNEGTMRLSRRATINGMGLDLLANNAGARLEINDGGFNVLNINLNNAVDAVIVSNEDVTINRAGGMHVNNGRILVHANRLEMTTGMLTGTTGELHIAHEGTAAFTGAATSASFAAIDNDGLLQISDASVTTGLYTGTGFISVSSTLNVTDDLVLFGDQSRVFVDSDGLITLGGIFSYQMTDEFDFEWLPGSILEMTGGMPGSAVCLEVGGVDFGVDPINHVGAAVGFEDNFELETLRLGPGAHVTLVDALDNDNRGGPFGVAEALYVDSLDLGVGAELNLNGLRLYYRNFLGTANQIVDLPAPICPLPTPCNTPTFDFDDDGDVDLFDFDTFNDCLTGQGGGILPGCFCADSDADADVDLIDWLAFQVAFTGP